MESVEIDAEFMQTVLMDEFYGDGDIPGRRHVFKFENDNLQVELPPLCMKDIFNRSHLFRFDESSTIYMWNKEGVVAGVIIGAIRISIIGLRIEIPREVGNHPFINHGLFTEDERRVMDKKSDEVYFKSQRALNYWIRIVRWKTGSHLMDRLHGIPPRETDGGALINSSTRTGFYVPLAARTVTLGPRYVIKSDSWEEIQSALERGDEPPIWHEYLASGHREMIAGDSVTATLNLAIAAESLIRTYIERKMPSGISKGLKDTAHRINISNLLNKWNSFGLPDFSEVNILRNIFEVRNKLMHSGKDDRANQQNFIISAKAVASLVEALE